MQLNAEVLCCLAEIWVNVFDFEAAGNVPRTPPVNLITAEVTRLLIWLGNAATKATTIYSSSFV